MQARDFECVRDVLLPVQGEETRRAQQARWQLRYVAARREFPEHLSAVPQAQLQARPCRVRIDGGAKLGAAVMQELRLGREEQRCRIAKRLDQLGVDGPTHVRIALGGRRVRKSRCDLLDPTPEVPPDRSHHRVPALRCGAGRPQLNVDPVVGGEHGGVDVEATQGEPVAQRGVVADTEARGARRRAVTELPRRHSSWRAGAHPGLRPRPGARLAVDSAKGVLGRGALGGRRKRARTSGRLRRSQSAAVIDCLRRGTPSRDAQVSHRALPWPPRGESLGRSSILCRCGLTRPATIVWTRDGGRWATESDGAERQSQAYDSAKPSRRSTGRAVDLGRVSEQSAGPWAITEEGGGSWIRSA